MPKTTKMNLSSGTRLGPYEILAPVGAGGMGEVYRAKDTRLDRIVAVKVLPTHLNGDVEVQQRFEREARAVSALNHPNICTLHDIGRESNIEYLVMEFLEGRTLAFHLEKGPFAIDVLLRYAIQMADALDKAHRRGIVHRDLKPSNVVLTKSGIKLLDFGLAKVAIQTRSSGQPPPMETEQRNLTEEGTILGTLHYMSPEQLEGKAVDARSDIFSFGAVLYEMATGKRAFDGSSAAGLIAAILKEDPKPISVFLPPGLERLIKACLAKDPEDRRQTAHDLVAELQWIAENRFQSRPVLHSTTVASWKSHLKKLALIALVPLVIFTAGYTTRQAPQVSISRTSILLPPDFRLDPFNTSLALSNDGRMLAFAGTDAEGKRGLWLRKLDQSEPRRIPGTEDATYPFWSPDGRYIGFFADHKLKKVAVKGGPVQTLCDAQDGRGGTWNARDIIVFCPSPGSGLYQISSAGGPLTQITKPEKKQITHRLPHFLPDGKRILFYLGDMNTPMHISEKTGIYCFDLDTQKITPILLEETEALYVEPGFLTFVRNGDLMVHRFDPTNLKIDGQAMSIAQGVKFYVERYTGAYSMSRDALVFQGEDEFPLAQLTWFDLEGNKLGTTGKPAKFSSLLLAPDEKRVLTTFTRNQSRDLWIWDLVIGTNSRVTFKKEPYYDGGMAWSPDGKQIVYGDLNGKLFIMDSNSGLTAKPLLKRDEKRRWWPTDWSFDGARIVLGTHVSGTGSDVGVLSLSDGSIEPFVSTEANETLGAFSPDGKFLGYVSDESGRPELYVVSYPGPGGKWQISTDGVTEWRWIDNGRRILYFTPDRRIYSVEVLSNGAVLQIGAQRSLFGGLAVSQGSVAIAPDGKRLLIAVPIEERRDKSLTFVHNWAVDLTN